MPHKQIEQRLHQTVRSVLPDADLTGVLVRPCPDPKFGDYQTTALMALAPRKLNPRQLATDVLARLEGSTARGSTSSTGAAISIRDRPHSPIRRQEHPMTP